MTSIDVAAAATSPRMPVEVLNRELLFRGAVVSIKVPLDAKEGTFDDGKGVQIRFIKFPRFVKKGAVNIFVHGDTPMDFLGKRITAAVEVYRKDFVDGRSFLYIDLHPLDEGSVATHRLEVMSGLPGTYSKHTCVAFPTPAPLMGEIIISPIDEHGEKIGFASNDSTPAPQVSKTGDSQLDRLLAVGWEIEGETEAQVSLRKGEGSKERRMTHFKIKKKL